MQLLKEDLYDRGPFHAVVLASFILGFIFAAIPWYVGAFILICARYDHPEKPGYIAFLIAAIIGTIAVTGAGAGAGAGTGTWIGTGTGTGTGPVPDSTLLEFAWIELLETNKSVTVEELAEGAQIKKAAGGDTMLLRFSEMLKLFHEFAHVVHCMSNCASCAKFSGTQLDPEFVEIPTLVLKNWNDGWVDTDSFTEYTNASDEKCVACIGKLKRIYMPLMNTSKRYQGYFRPNAKQHQNSFRMHQKYQVLFQLVRSTSSI
ncbi:hypothetical protein L2E82_28271 [Cichorium intybus]|uniref:Uncharacterized protein n=1 Tax=Cichorium intybus TaxID=13427 RepID=A0ACB9CV48_CICIN|nr:hypothetical protein L2E82_28271 [Cichorium intybus]